MKRDEQAVNVATKEGRISCIDEALMRNMRNMRDERDEKYEKYERREEMR